MRQLSGSGAVIGAVFAVILLLLWLIVLYLRRGRRRAGGSDDVINEALTIFSEQSMLLSSFDEILVFAKQAAEMIFGISRVVAFERGDEEGVWEARIPRAEDLGAVPAALGGLFGWLRHNSNIAVQDDLASDPRFGAMRGPLRNLMQQYKIDVVLPLVERQKVLAVLGLSLGRAPTERDRDGMRLFRLAATAACANVRLHREAAHLVTLAREVDLASAIELALVPSEKNGKLGAMSWAGHYEQASQAGSDFWSIYPLDQGRLFVVMGDAAGVELAGSMVSAVVRSCSDAIFDQKRAALDPATFLTALNRALYRTGRPAVSSAFAALFDPIGKRLVYANAGHPLPFMLRFSRGGTTLSSLAGSGILLGDSPEGAFKTREVPLGGDDAVIFYTNGLLKVRDHEKREFRERTLERVLAAQTGNGAEQIRDAVVAALKSHRAPRKLADDLALVVVSSRLI